jgi:DNA (cytosine-5)-methyltransferase 1
MILAPELSIESRLERLSKLHGSSELATRIGTNRRSVERWIRGDSKAPQYLDAALTQLFGTPPSMAASPRTDVLTFADLFAGIGGIRLGLESAGAACVFTSEWDKYAVKTYSANHVSSHEILGDINSVQSADLPDHDILAGGFPCQPFSLAGVSKKNSLGREHGFLDKTQGTLFFNIASVIADKRPKAVLLENVKNLLSHDGRRTFRVIQDTIEKELGYRLHYQVLDARAWVPQHRERVLMVAMRDGQDFDWSRVRAGSTNTTLDTVLHKEDGTERQRDYLGEDGKVLDKYTLSDGLWAYLQNYAAKHKAAGNGFGFGLVDRTSVSRTLSARYYKDGSEILVSQGPDRNPRRLTPRECARLMGFEDSFRIPVSDTQAYKQFGNSVAVPVISSVSAEIVRQLHDN